jgi:hypothetical protein
MFFLLIKINHTYNLKEKKNFYTVKIKYTLVCKPQKRKEEYFFFF